MVLHLPHAEGGFGVPFNCVTKDTAFCTTTSRFVSWIGTFSQARQELWLPKDDLRDSSSWSSPPFVLLRDIHTNLVAQYDYKEVCASSQSQANIGTSLTDTKDKIISLDVLLKADFKVDFAAGTSDDPNFGGYLITPTGSRVVLVFENNLWRVPLWAPPMRSPARHAMPAKVLIKSGTTNFLPAPCSTQDLKAVSTIKHIIATIQHDGFLHPLGVEQGYIGNGLRETATNEYIKQTYGSLLL
jgi:hypothetical protein